MRKYAMAVMVVLCAGVIAACESAIDDLTGVNSCAGLNGLYTASSFLAVGTQDATLSHNLLANGGSLTISFTGTNFTSNFRATTGATPITRQGAFVTQNGTITLGNQTIFTGAAAGTQLFACTASGRTLTLIASNSSYLFPGQSTAFPARLTIELSKP